MSISAEQRLKDLGIVLPSPPKPLGAYVEAVQAGSLLFLSGTLPMEGGVPRFRGRIGEELTVEEGRNAARLAALNSLALAKQHLGSLDKVVRVVRVTVSLMTSASFVEHARVADGASEVLASVFGAERMSTRMVVGVASLPVGASVVVEVVLAV